MPSKKKTPNKKRALDSILRGDNGESVKAPQEAPMKKKTPTKKKAPSKAPTRVSQRSKKRKLKDDNTLVAHIDLVSSPSPSPSRSPSPPPNHLRPPSPNHVTDDIIGEVVWKENEHGALDKTKRVRTFHGPTVPRPVVKKPRTRMPGKASSQQPQISNAQSGSHPQDRFNQGSRHHSQYQSQPLQPPISTKHISPQASRHSQAQSQHQENSPQSGNQSQRQSLRHQLPVPPCSGSQSSQSQLPPAPPLDGADLPPEAIKAMEDGMSDFDEEEEGNDGEGLRRIRCTEEIGADGKIIRSGRGVCTSARLDYEIQGK